MRIDCQELDEIFETHISRSINIDTEKISFRKFNLNFAYLRFFRFYPMNDLVGFARNGNTIPSGIPVAFQ
jgi:hypothetical protein